MTVDILIFMGVIIAALAAMALLGRGLPSRSKWRCSTYGTSKNLRGKYAMRLAILALNEGRFGLNPFESDDEDGNNGSGKGGYSPSSTPSVDFSVHAGFHPGD